MAGNLNDNNNGKNNLGERYKYILNDFRYHWWVIVQIFETVLYFKDINELTFISFTQNEMIQYQLQTKTEMSSYAFI